MVSVRPYVRPSVRGFRPLSRKVIPQLMWDLVYVFAGRVFRIGSPLGHIGQILAHYRQKMVVSDHYLKKYSYNPIQTVWQCLHIVGWCAEMIRFWATLVKFWPSCGHKMTKNCSFRPLSEKVIMKSNLNLVCTLIDNKLDHFLTHRVKQWNSEVEL